MGRRYNSSAKLGPLTFTGAGLGFVLLIWALSFAMWAWFIYFIVKIAEFVHAWPF